MRLWFWSWTFVFCRRQVIVKLNDNWSNASLPWSSKQLVSSKVIKIWLLFISSECCLEESQCTVSECRQDHWILEFCLLGHAVEKVLLNELNTSETVSWSDTPFVSHECQWQWINAITSRCRDFHLSHNLRTCSGGKVALFEADHSHLSNALHCPVCHHGVIFKNKTFVCALWYECRFFLSKSRKESPVNYSFG